MRENNPDLDLFSASSLRQTDFEAALKQWGFSRTDRETFIGGRVLEYRDESNGTSLSVDLYVGSLIFSHEVPITERISIDWPTLPLAELLATKLQVHLSQDKDLMDIIMLVGEHKLGRGDDETINVPVLMEMFQRDWGLWMEAKRNLKQASERLDDAQSLPAEFRLRTKKKLCELASQMNEVSGSILWRLRAIAGDRISYWNEVQEWRA